MFGFGVPEFTVLLVLLIAVAVFHKMRQPTQSELYGGNKRRCLACDYQGKMETWISGYGLPKFIILIGLLFYLIPGIIFWAWASGKYKCPRCGALAKNVALPSGTANSARQLDEKKCPFCAENIKVEAKVCRYCGRDLPEASL